MELVRDKRGLEKVRGGKIEGSMLGVDQVLKS